MPAIRSSTRNHLISAALDFCEHATQMPGVERVAFIGSICTDKPEPKDVDLLLTITPAVDMEKLAKLGRQLKGKTQRINHGADIFLANTEGKYIGRTCRWRECRPGLRMACEALHCGRVQYLYDDLQIVDIKHHQIANPPLIIHPKCIVNFPVPSDLMKEVRERFKTAPGGSG
jgi:predicted nucleotidyltransferase